MSESYSRKTSLAPHSSTGVGLTRPRPLRLPHHVVRSCSSTPKRSTSSPPRPLMLSQDGHFFLAQHDEDVLGASAHSIRQVKRPPTAGSGNRSQDAGLPWGTEKGEEQVLMCCPDNACVHSKASIIEFLAMQRQWRRVVEELHDARRELNWWRGQAIRSGSGSGAEASRRPDPPSANLPEEGKRDAPSTASAIDEEDDGEGGLHSRQTTSFHSSEDERCDVLSRIDNGREGTTPSPASTPRRCEGSGGDGRWWSSGFSVCSPRVLKLYRSYSAAQQDRVPVYREDADGPNEKRERMPACENHQEEEEEHPWPPEMYPSNTLPAQWTQEAEGAPPFGAAPMQHVERGACGGRLMQTQDPHIGEAEWNLGGDACGELRESTVAGLTSTSATPDPTARDRYREPGVGPRLSSRTEAPLQPTSTGNESPECIRDDRTYEPRSVPRADAAALELSASVTPRGERRNHRSPPGESECLCCRELLRALMDHEQRLMRISTERNEWRALAQKAGYVRSGQTD